ncbi:restriction endonuclease [Lacipirellula sp.]|uniref:restriction endonuclease n=1 Tax=Lacipirellula sp. TaxID=2691419 RepID=UPI003D0D0DF7
MSLPNYQEFMLPFLTAIADGKPHRISDLIDRLADALTLNDEQRSELLPSGQRVLANRVGWARTYLKKAGLIESPERGLMLLSDRGRSVLNENLQQVNQQVLDRFPEFREWRTAKKDEGAGEGPSPNAETVASLTPDEVMEAAYRELNDQVASDLLETLKRSSPYFFEKVVLTLLAAMGYGGVHGGSLITPASGDGGIDGLIHEDKLGLDTVCVQAKRWEGTVGRPVVQGFVGSMDMHRSRKGVVITTGRYSQDAHDYVNRIEGKKVVLIDGVQLAQLMIEHRVGVAARRTYVLVDLSQDFFDEQS